MRPRIRPLAAALATLAAATTAIAVSTPMSLASWRDAEWVTATARVMECGDPETIDSTAWGRVLTGSLLGRPLDPIAAIDGITVTNTDEISVATSDADTNDVGEDAWTTDLNLAALSLLDLGAGVTLPFGTNTGVYTQYGRATSDGVSVGASGAVTSTGGIASLEPPGSATPRLATLRLADVLDSVLPGVGMTSALLADLRVRVGAVGAIAELDSCDALWAKEAPGSDLERDYLVADLGLDVTSTVVTDIASAIRSALNGLESTLDGLDFVTTTIPGTLTTALNSALNLPLVRLGQIESLGVAIDVDLDPVRALVAGPITDGVVTLDLTTGRVSLDLDALFGEAYASSDGLNGLAPNTSVLTPEVLSAATTRLGALLSDFLTTTVVPEVTTAIDDAQVTVDIAAKLDVTVSLIPGVPIQVPDALQFTTKLSGTVGGFLGTAGHAVPSADTVVDVVPGLGTVSGVVSALLGDTLGTIVGLVTTNVRAIGSTVVTPLRAQAITAVGTAISTLTGPSGPIASLLIQLRGVFDAVNTLVDLTVNARPDAPGSVGAPASAPAGRYFVSALHVGLVDGGGAGLGALYLANASVGPNALRD